MTVRRSRRAIFLLAVASIVAAASGCYEKRVTRGYGIGSDRGAVQQSDLNRKGPLDRLGDAVFGDPE